VPHLEVAPHLRAAQVEIAVGQPQVLVHAVATDVIERERGRVGDIVNLELTRHDFDPAGRQAGVLRARGPGHDAAGDSDHRLRLQMLQLAGERRVVVRLQLHLGDALAVAQVDENDAALIADRVHPAEQGDGRPDVGHGELGTVVSALHLKTKRPRRRSAAGWCKQIFGAHAAEASAPAHRAQRNPR